MPHYCVAVYNPARDRDHRAIARQSVVEIVGDLVEGQPPTWRRQDRRFVKQLNTIPDVSVWLIDYEESKRLLDPFGEAGAGVVEQDGKLIVVLPWLTSDGVVDRVTKEHKQELFHELIHVLDDGDVPDATSFLSGDYYNSRREFRAYFLMGAETIEDEIKNAISRIGLYYSPGRIPLDGAWRYFLEFQLGWDTEAKFLDQASRHFPARWVRQLNAENKQLLEDKLLDLYDDLLAEYRQKALATLATRNASYRIADVVQIDSDLIQRWRLGLLRFLRSVDKVIDYDTAFEFKDVAKRYNKELESTIIDRFLKKYLPYELGLSVNLVEYWTKRLRKSAWNLHIELMSVPIDRADDYYSKEARYHQFDQRKDKWLAAVQRHARTLWKDLKEFIDQYQYYNTTAEKPYVETLDVQNYTLAGFAVQLVGAGQGYHSKDTLHFLDTVEHALKLYRKAAAEKFPWLLRHTLPLVLRFDVTLDKGGEYNYDHITIYMSALSGLSQKQMDPAKVLAKTIAHEMGHTVYRRYLSQDATAFWNAAIRQDQGPNLDLRYVLKHWPERYDNLIMVDDVFLALGDIDTFLQLNSLYYDPSYRHWTENATKKDIEARIEEEGPYLIVPKHPISGYASKNSEEAFCEAFGKWLVWGDQAVYPIVRSWLSVVLPEAKIRTARFRDVV